MPFDVLRRLATPFVRPVAGSRYPLEAPPLAPATRGLPELDPALCGERTACATACAAVCPTGAIEVASGGWVVDAGSCIFCGDCAIACPNSAVTMSRRVELASADRSALRSSSTRADGSAALAADRLRARLHAKFGRSVHVRHLDAGSCNGCDWEINALLNPYHDIQRLGVDFVASPRHADVLLVTGAMTANLEEAARRTFEAMPEPRLVVAVGACAISGGPFAGSPVVRSGAAEVLPVDVFVPGCPPRPEAIVEGILLAADRRRVGEGPDGLSGAAPAASVSK